MSQLLNTVYQPLLETLYMVAFSTVFSLLLGIPLGTALVVSSKGHICENTLLNRLLSTIVNVGRSLPFIILMILVFPLSRFIVGTTIGTTASIVPLSIAAAPFVARIIESSLLEVDKGKIESSIAMGSSNIDIIRKVLLPESLVSIVLGITLTIINLIGYSAMAGAIGAGGLGDLAIRFGFYRFQTDVMLISVLVIIILVQGTQFLGNQIAFSINKKRGKI